MPLNPPLFEALEGASSVTMGSSRERRHRPECGVGQGFSSVAGQPGCRAVPATRRCALSWGICGAAGLRGPATQAGSACCHHNVNSCVSVQSGSPRPSWHSVASWAPVPRSSSPSRDWRGSARSRLPCWRMKSATAPSISRTGPQCRLRWVRTKWRMASCRSSGHSFTTDTVAACELRGAVHEWRFGAAMTPRAAIAAGTTQAPPKSVKTQRPLR